MTVFDYKGDRAGRVRQIIPTLGRGRLLIRLRCSDRVCEGCFNTLLIPGVYLVSLQCKMSFVRGDCRFNKHHFIFQKCGISHIILTNGNNRYHRRVFFDFF